MKKQFGLFKPLQLLVLLAVLTGAGIYGAKSHMITTDESSPGRVEGTTKVSTKKPSNDKSSKKPDISVKDKAPKQTKIARKVTLNKRYYLLDAPNDPKYATQWALTKVNAPAGWSASASADNVVVADIDTGFALNHQDLTNQWHLNDGEANDGKESNGIDDDSNGYVDDWRGWDFYMIDNDPQAGENNPKGEGVEHGTETAGLIGASTNNGIGIASVSGGAQIMPLQVMSDDGTGYSDDIAAAIYYAADNGANVINMSLGTAGDDVAVRDAVDYAVAHNIVVIAAAGNCGNSDQDVCSGQIDGYVTFPASYDRVVAVGAVDQNNTQASFSSYGERLDVMAPGSGSLISTTWTAGNGTSAYVTNLHGTSFASPITAGAAALIRSIRPDSSVDDVRALLMASTKQVNGMGSRYYTSNYGHGLLDIGKAMQIADSLNNTAEQLPTPHIAGGNKAEKQFSASSTIGGGCTDAIASWCTLWLRNTTKEYDRFLPYQLTNSEGETGWSWSGSALLQSGEWSVRARQGDTVSSTPLLIFSK